MVQSLLAQGKAQGFLPVYSIGGKENFCMIGNHAIPMVAAAWVRGFGKKQGAEALALMQSSTTENHTNSDWPVLTRYGYYPIDKVETESASRTAESGVDDAAIAYLASKMGKADVATTYAKRAGYYKNLMDPKSHLLRGRYADGKWRTPFEPLRPTSPMNNPGDYTEANAWQYTWTPAQHDLPGLIQTMGGQAGFEKQLNQFFTLQTPNPNKHLGQEALIGQYAHGNEVSHHVAWLFAYTSTPAKGYGIIQRIYKDFYKPKPNGLIGNEDCGAMSAWYLYATLGFYPINPFDGSYVLGRPQVSHAVVHLPKYKNLVVQQGGSRVLMNGKPVEGPVVWHADLAGGGVLQFPDKGK
jgi:predicted alpha-1,2-mannosidase